MGLCSDECNCLVDGDRGILVTGTGDAGSGYVVSPDSSRNVTLFVLTRDDLPTLTDDDAGTYAHVRDTGINFVWTIASGGGGGHWETVGAEWYRADVADVAVDELENNTNGFVTAGEAAFVIHAKGWVEAVVPAGAEVEFYFHINRSDDLGNPLDDTELTLTNDSGGDRTMRGAFSLLATIGLGTPSDVCCIMIGHGRVAGSGVTDATLKNARIFAQRIAFLDTTTACP